MGPTALREREKTFTDKTKLNPAARDDTLGLLDYDKNRNHDYFGQYCNHGYFKRLLVGHMTRTLCERFI